MAEGANRYEHLERIDAFARRGLVMCLLWPLLASPVSPFLSKFPASFAPFPGVTVEEFDITGMTDRQIYDALNHSPIDNPVVAGEKAAAATWTTPEWEWHRSYDASGRCTPAGITVSMRARVMLPRLVSGHAPRDVVARWKGLRTEIEVHEAGHLRIGYSTLPKIAAALAAGDCDSAEKRAALAWTEADIANARWDLDDCRAFAGGAPDGESYCALYAANLDDQIKFREKQRRALGVLDRLHANAAGPSRAPCVSSPPQPLRCSSPRLPPPSPPPPRRF